ncbi:MAG: hypothetical protein ACRD19_12250 [Terriglobia bacterium]
MKKLAYGALIIALAATTGFARPKSGAKSGEVFTGNISDSMCGLKHPMADAKRCTLGCVKGFDGTTFVLADEAHQKVYNLSDQRKAKAYAGENVEVRGTLDGDSIHVISIKGAQ